MSASPYLKPDQGELLIPLSVLGLRDGEDLPGVQELCRLAGIFFGVSMFAVTWLRDASPVSLWSSGTCQRMAGVLARWSYPALHSPGVVTASPTDMARWDGASAAPDPSGASAAIGFFAAAPLTLADGVRVGALCIADTNSRTFSDDDALRLRDFAAVASEGLRAQKALADTRRREQLLARAFRLAKVGGWEYNVITGSLTLSEQALEIYGMDTTLQPTLDMMMRRFYPGDTLIDTREDFARLLREGQGYDSRRRIQRLDGSSRWIHVLAEPESQEGQVVRVHGLVEDITDEVESQRRFHELAYTDKLTSLPNRGAFLLELGRHFSRQEPIVLIAIDIDGFKDINDTIGHHAGDQLLIEVGKRITAYFPVGTFAARVGSNEFTVIAPANGLIDNAVDQMNQLRLQLKQPVHYAEQTLSASVSIGLCEAPAQASDADQIVRNTDIALYQAKKVGGDRTVVFEPEMRDRLEERVQLLRDVRRGIERKEFILYYQPIYDMRTYTLSGFEALMRWSLPEKGILTPSYFNAAFDDQTLAPQLGDEALRNAFEQMRRWMKKGFDFKRVSVNVAAAQFYRLDLAGHILSMLRQYGLRPDQLTLEITESVYLGPGADAVEDALRILHQAGVGIALDDFGTGYASLTQLQRFPVDSLKIDKSFVQNPGAASIVDAIIALGTSLNIQIVAEGVESAAHQETLLRRGCRFGQGYFLGKPMPAEFYA
jgi:diguanylate cyclase (GGDEF)-like protein/PAS domain S-box-containing protein